MTCCNSRSCSPSAGCASSPCCQSESALSATTAASVVDWTVSAKSKPATTTNTASTASETADAATERLTTIRTLITYPDPRGSVRESFRASWDKSIPPIVQIVHSESEPNVMRAMHSHELQYDIWHFTAGSAFVQLYDIDRREHSTFWAYPETTLIIPPRVAHGFYTPTGCTLVYALTREYDGTDEYEFDAYSADFPGASLWPAQWAVTRSGRDQKAPSFASFLETMSRRG